MRALRWVITAIATACLTPLVACGTAADTADIAPPRATDAITFPTEPSTIAVDLDIDLADLETVLERELPRKLWQIDRPDSECIASKKVDLAVITVKSPKIKCRITGKVTRGRLRLSGTEQRLMVTLPVNGTLAARDVAGVFKGETATGKAEVALGVRLDLDSDWRLASTTKLDYRWTKEPGIDFVGQRITFTEQADRELRPVKRDIERIIARELAKLPVKETATQGWREAHTVLELNARNPAVWGRSTPQRFRYGGYTVKGRVLTLRLGLDTLFEAFVGKQPEAIAAAALPSLAQRDKNAVQSVLHVPVVADYAVLEPVVAKALAERSQRPFVIADFGSVTAQFDDIAVYGTGKGRIAVGATFSARSSLPGVKSAKGSLWLTALPVNDPGSREVRFADVKVSGDTDLSGEMFLFALANAPEFQDAISNALEQNFERDFNALLEKIDRALVQRRGG